MNGQQVHLINPEQARALLVGSVLPWLGEQLKAGRAVVAEFRLAEDAFTDKQRAYYHGCILANIAAQARPNGEAYPLAVWKEFFRDRFLGYKTKTTPDPITGKKKRRRVRQSTEGLGMKGYADLIEKVAAYGATELGVSYPDEWIDPESGEVFSLKDATQRRHVRERKRELEQAEGAPA